MGQRGVLAWSSVSHSRPVAACPPPRGAGRPLMRAAALVASHVGATYRRVAAVERVLAVQDTTFVDWPGGDAAGGLVVHTTLALSPERVPLGLLAQDAWTRAAAAPGRADRKARPI